MIRSVFESGMARALKTARAHWSIIGVLLGGRWNIGARFILVRNVLIVLFVGALVVPTACCHDQKIGG